MAGFLLPHTPKPLSPRYGRRISNHGSPASRRLSLMGGTVFDGLIDGFSPIKAGPPPKEELEMRGLVAVDLEKEYARVSTNGLECVGEGNGSGTGSVIDQQQQQQQEDGDADEDEDDESSGEFDIDQMVVTAGGGGGGRANKRGHVGNGLKSELEGLPKRNRTLKPSIAKKSKKTSGGGGGRKQAAKTKKALAGDRRRKPVATAVAAEDKQKVLDTDGFDDIDGFQLAEETVWTADNTS
ncbi:hypothetical protein H4R99_001489 [Coemansia sp. RSA 1722]|nr:hypothetical protein LPJ57_001922 [Coemansia sp. RSA 486]KAJ2232727.1 hypothetical protein IWW45_004746 [Coemansia sp. RSA 485]KAJ2604911.1 hypothetical protein H4R99_001489 [Coemansia sp. RSA 1722]